MKGPLGFSAEDLMQETLSMQRKLREGLKLLPGVEDVDYGVTERQEVWRDGKVVLYRFVGDAAPVARTPLLIVYALVNRPYMVDLQADRSLVKGLLGHGQDVYVLDWGYPDRSERYLTLEDYLLRYIDGAVDHLRAASGLEAVDVLGICQGGTFALCYAALERAKIRNLITMVTPVDFHTPDNMLSNWARMVDVDLFVDTMGNVPADLMNASYLMLKPFRLNLQNTWGCSTSSMTSRRWRTSCAWKNGSSIRPTWPAKRSANSSPSSTSAMAWSPAMCVSAGRWWICTLSTCRCSTSMPSTITWCRPMPRAPCVGWWAARTTPS